MKTIHSNKKLVSIALCTYNGEKWLRPQIESILAQSWNNLELMIVDDASKDGTLEIIKEYADKDPRIKWQANAENLGYNRNFEKAIRACSSEFIAISDQDDIWEPNKIEIIMEHWLAGSLFIYSLSGDFYTDDFSNRKPAPKVFYSDINDTHKLVFNSPVHGHASMFKKELLDRAAPFPPGIFYDWWLSMHAANTNMGTIGCVPYTLTWHRVHEENSSRYITSINNKQERDKQLREQCAFFIETFFEKKAGRKDERKSLLTYAALLRKMDGKKFYWPMFWYVMKKRRLIFHYKKKPFVFISHLKHAFKMAVRGLL